MKEREQEKCCVKTNCAGNKFGRCVLLTDTRFETKAGHKKPCPFFKTQEQADYDKRRAEDHFFKKYGYYYTPETRESDKQKAILTKKKKYRSYKKGNRTAMLENKVI